MLCPIAADIPTKAMPRVISMMPQTAMEISLTGCHISAFQKKKHQVGIFYHAHTRTYKSNNPKRLESSASWKKSKSAHLVINVDSEAERDDNR